MNHPTTTIDHERIERAVNEILIAIGEDPERDGLADRGGEISVIFRQQDMHREG